MISKVFKAFILSITTIALVLSYSNAQPDSMMEDSMMESDSMMSSSDAVMFQAFILNSSTAETLNTSNGSVPVPLAPGVWVVHQDPGPLFTAGHTDRGEGLEALAEDGNPAALDASLATNFESSGVFNTPLGADQPGPALPGDIYSFTFSARPGDYLNFATMFVQSNDLFYSPSGQGIALFDEDGNPTAGNVSDQVSLWDSGTEVDEEPGTGPNQAPRQSGPNTGDDENGLVVLEDPRPSTNNRVVSVVIVPIEANNSASGY